MRYYPFVILGFLVGCLEPFDGRPEASGGGSDPASDEPPSYYGDDGPGFGGPCGDAFDVMQVQGPNGEVGTVIIPIPCDPYYFDKGYPLPDEVEQEDPRGDPAPDRMVQPVQFIR